MRAVAAYLDAKLPEDLRDPTRVYDSKSVARLLASVAERHPDKYAGVAKLIADTGRKASYSMGETVGLEDLRSPVDRAPILASMDTELSALELDKILPQEERKQRRKEIMGKYSDLMEKAVMDAGNLSGNAVTRAVASGARGKPPQAKAMIGSAGVYTGFDGGIIPIFSRQSYAEGVRPAAYMASTYGARSSVISTKVATARGGDLGKQVSQTMSDMVVTSPDCRTANGIDLEAADSSLQGRVLLTATGPFPAGTFIDAKTAGAIKKAGKPVLVRSALTCQAAHGVCAKCAGASFGNRHLPKVGENMGIRAGNALTEPVTQGALNTKHCLLEGTEVRMADMTTRAIELIEPGEYVLGADLKGNTFPVKVLHKWDQGMQNVLKITYARGQTKQTLELFATAEHPVLSNKKTSSAHNRIKFKGAFGSGCPANYESYKLPAAYPHKDLAAVLPVSCTLPGRTPESLAWLCGLLMGDGIRYTGKGKQCFSCAEPDLASEIDERLRPFGLTLVKSKRSHDWRIANRDWKGGNNTSKANRLDFLRSKISEWGLLDCYAHEKSIPSSAVTTWDTQSIGDFIGGFIATDGSVFKNADGHVGVSFASTSRELLEGVKFLLEKFLCVYAGNVTRTAKAGTGNYRHDVWSIYVTRLDQVKHLAEVCRIPGRKAKILRDELAAATYQVRNPEPFFRAKRRSIEPIGVRHCWDITVEHVDELFVLANGLIVKNTSGAYKGKRSFSGLNVITQFVQAPEEFAGRAAVAEEDGYVDKIAEAPQGGSIVTIGNKDHYVLPGYSVTAKVGDKVEAGDALSDGLVDPKDIIRLKGLGEGRRYYATRFKQILDDSGHDAHLRNTELLARAAIDHVQIADDEGYGDHLPDDTASYNSILAKYVPPETAKAMRMVNAEGKFLASPVLHYSIGTKITPSMIKRTQAAGLDIGLVDDSPPPFVPTMTRLRTQGEGDDDWLAKQMTSYIKSNIAEDAIRGRDTNIHSNIRSAPRQAYGVDYGKNLGVTGKY